MDVRAWTVAMGATAAGMVATGFARRGGAVRRVLTPVVVSGLATATAAGVLRRWGPARTLAALIGTVASTGLVEHLGVRTGRPFGGYRYTSALQPQVAGVPVVVPVAWFAMAVPAREAAHAALGQRSSVGTRIVGGAVALTAWDLFLDPQMVGEGYWQWERPGRYRCIPLTNFAGWFLTALGVMALLELVLPPVDPVPKLVGQYGFVAVMETTGFATFFGDRLVALAGGTAMLPVAAVAGLRACR